MKKIAIIVLVFVIIFTFTLFFIISSNKKDVLLEIPKYSNGYTVANLLTKQQILYNKYVFLLLLKLSFKDNNIIAGEFLFKKGISVFSIINLITNSKNIYYHKITIIEGSTVKETIYKMYQDKNLTGLITIKLVEGSIMPNTYLFPKGQDRNLLLKQMQLEMQNYLDALWLNKNANLPYKNKQEALIMASLIEKESSYKDERRLISGVFLNRLKLNMKLQTDPTVAYGLGKKSAESLTKNDLSSKTPYNTYIINGLPPTAIALPSKKSLEAAFNPQHSNYLYFVANGSGGHSFATNYQDHLKNVAKWRIVEKELKKQSK